MKASRKLGLGLLLLALAATATYEARMLRRQRGELHASRTEVTALERDVATARRAYAAHAAELKLAETQLATLPGPATADASTPERARRAELEAWAGRTVRLKRLFDERPDQRIPELKLLSDAEWLQLSRRIDFESENGLRTALAAVRDLAKRGFHYALGKAIDRFNAESGGKPPATILALAPYFEGTVDLAILQRYAIGRDESGRKNTPAWLAREAATPDPDFDTRAELLPGGTTRNRNPPLAWTDNMNERTRRATTAFQQQHGRPPTGYPDLLPFFDPPLTPKQAELILIQLRDREAGKL